MNPVSSSALDPKLKEVYDRVMGTSVHPTPPTPQVTPPHTPSSAPPQPISSNPSTHPTTVIHPVQQSPVSPQVAPQGFSAPLANPMNKTVPPPRPASVVGAPQQQSAVDYAALAAKYATPQQPQQMTVPAQPFPIPQQQSQRHAAVTPSSTTYGVVNGGSETKTENKSFSEPESEQKSGTLKKIILIAGILMFFVIYTFVWIVVFGFELPI